MHPSAERLYQVAKALKPSITGQSAVARWLNESPQTVKNWEGRGVSRKGALKVQQLSGWNADWLLSGDGPQRIGEVPDGAAKGDVFQALTEDERRLLANFRDLVDEDDRRHIIEEVANKAAKMRALRERFLAELGMSVQRGERHAADARKTDIAHAALRVTDNLRQQPLFTPDKPPGEKP